MSTGTKHTAAIIGTIVGTGVAVAAFLGTSLGGRMTSIEGRMTNIENELRATRADLREEIRATRTELRDEIHATRTELREEIRAADGRVRTVETGFARVDQRLETVERAVIPSAEPPSNHRSLPVAQAHRARVDDVACHRHCGLPRSQPERTTREPA